MYIHTMEYYSAIKKDELIPSSATWMDLESITLSEVRQIRRNIGCHPLYAESKKKWYKWTYLRSTNWLTDLENEFMVIRGEGWGEGIVRELGMDMYTLLCLKWIIDKDLQYSTGNSAQGYLAARIRVGVGREGIHVYVWLSLFAVHLKLSQHC